jgi:branched-chain amino acid aminotransferase
VKVDGRMIGDGRPGPLTRELVRAYHALTNSTGQPIYP